MAAMVKMIRKEFIRYTKEHWPDEAEAIIRRADRLYPALYAKAPDIGGPENVMAYNLDLLILSASFSEASGHRIDGEVITEMAKRMCRRYRFVGKFVNANHKWQMKLARAILYRRYTPYVKLVEEKLSRGEWNNTWRVRIDPRNTGEGICFDVIGCPLADYARANGYMGLLPYMCAADHLMSGLVHAKLIRTHTCATGSESCDFWYVGDRSETARAYRQVEMK